MSTCKALLFCCYLTCGFSLADILIYGGETVARILGKMWPLLNNMLTDCQLISQRFGGYLSIPPAQWIKRQTQDPDVLEEAGKEI